MALQIKPSTCEYSGTMFVDFTKEKKKFIIINYPIWKYEKIAVLLQSWAKICGSILMIAGKTFKTVSQITVRII